MDRKGLLAAITAKVIKGLPAPAAIRFIDDQPHLDLDSIADCNAWRELAVDTKKTGRYDYRYDPSKEHPHGHRIVGDRFDWMGTRLSILAGEDLPPAYDERTDEETVLTFVDDHGDGPIDGCECEDCEALAVTVFESHAAHVAPSTEDGAT